MPSRRGMMEVSIFIVFSNKQGAWRPLVDALMGTMNNQIRLDDGQAE